MLQLDCAKLCEDVIEGCDYRINAISEHEMKELIQAHLKQDHPDDLAELSADKFDIIYDRIHQEFQN